MHAGLRNAISAEPRDDLLRLLPTSGMAKGKLVATTFIFKSRFEKLSFTDEKSVLIDSVLTTRLPLVRDVGILEQLNYSLLYASLFFVRDVNRHENLTMIVTTM